MTTSDFTLPGEIPDFGIAAPALAQAGAATDGRFLLDGEHGLATGTLCGGVDRVEIGGTLVASDLALLDAHVVRFVASPGLLRRELVRAGRSVVESTLVARTLPLAAQRWNGLPAGSELRLTVLPEAAGSRRVVDGKTLVATDPARPDRVAVAAVLGADAEWRLDDGFGPGLSCVLREAGSPTLLLTAGDDRAVRAALGAAAHLDAHARRSAEPVDALTVRTGVDDIDDGVAWASTRLVGACARPAGHRFASAANLFWTGLGALALGDGDAARGVLARCEAQPAPSDAQASALADLLAARVALSTGDASAAQRRARGLLNAGARVRPGLAREACLALADALRHSESERTIAELASLAYEPKALPMAGAPSPGFSLGTALREVRGLAPGVAALAEAWSGGAPDEVWRVWRAALTGGLIEGSAGPGTWDTPVRAGAPATGALLAALVFGILGAEPDAPAGRLRLAPSLPTRVNAFRVEGLRVGDAWLTCDYAREGARHTFVIEPGRARVPPMIVLEPLLPGTRLISAWVDGKPAEVDVAGAGARVRVRLQLPADAPRRVDLETV